MVLRPGVVLDMRHKEAGDEITIEDMRGELERIGYTLHAGDIVLPAYRVRPLLGH